MKLLDAMNEQMNFELESAYIYKTMEAWLNDYEMPGMAHFMAHQVKEELEHAEKLQRFLESIGHRVTFRTLNPGDGKFDSLLDVFSKALAHEKVVTKNIHNLIQLAIKEQSHAAHALLNWYITEQVEEEETFRGICTRLERAGEAWGPLYILDAELGKR